LYQEKSGNPVGPGGNPLKADNVKETTKNRDGPKPGLPDGLFSNPKSQFWYILEGLAMGNLGIFYDHSVYFSAIGNILWPIWYILWSFGIFFPDLVFCTKKNLATLAPDRKKDTHYKTF
jgi:hypothetical protein